MVKTISFPTPAPDEVLPRADRDLRTAIDDIEQAMASALSEKDVRALARIKTLLRPFACQLLALEDSCGDYQNFILRGK